MRVPRFLLIMAVLAMMAAACSSADDTASPDTAADTEAADQTAAEADDTAADDEDPPADADDDGDEADEPAADGGEPLRVAIVPALSGNFAAVGDEIVNAAQLAVDLANDAGGVDGRQVELVVLETDGQPATALQRVERALEEENAPFIGGIITSGETLAVIDQVAAADGLFVNWISTADEILQACNDRVFSTITPNRQIINSLALEVPQLADSWSIIALDFPTGHEQARLFAEAVEAAGGTTFEPIFVPQGETEFGPQIAQLQDQGAEGLFSVVQGASAVALTQQAEQFGYFDTIQAVAGYQFVMELTFGAQGEIVEGYVGNFPYYAPVHDTEKNREFVAAFEEAHGAQPTFVGGNTYVGLDVLFQAVEQAGSIEPEAVAEAMRAGTFDTALADGQDFRDGDQLLQRTEYIGEIVVTDDGTLAWEEIAAPSFEEAGPDNACA